MALLVQVKQGRLIMQQVPMIYERILHCTAQNREKIVADLCKTVFGDSEEARSDVQISHRPEAEREGGGGRIEWYEMQYVWCPPLNCLLIPVGFSRSSNKSYMDSVLRNIDFLINLEPEVASGKAAAPKDGSRNSTTTTAGSPSISSTRGGVDENGHYAGEWQVTVDAMRLSPSRVWQMHVQGLQFHTKQSQQQSSKKSPEVVEIKNHQGEKITGLRHRLYSPTSQAQKQNFIPFDGKLCVRVTTPGGTGMWGKETLFL